MKIESPLHERLMEPTPENIVGDRKIRVSLEPSLQEQAELLTAAQRRSLAKVYRRWARQLDVSAKIMESDEKPDKRDPMKPLVGRRLKMN